MDQAAPQPARAGSATPAHVAVPAPAHTASVAQPEKSWGEKSLEPGVFWSAASAVFTLAAVLVALFGPRLSEARQQKRRRMYAIAMLPPVLAEAIRAADMAQQCYELAEEIAKTIGGPLTANIFTATQAVTIDAATLKIVPTPQAYDYMNRLVGLTFPEFAANRLWLLDLDPSEAGPVQNAFSDAERTLRDISHWASKWTGRVGMNRGEAGMFAERARRVAISMRVAARVLAKVTDGQLPDDWPAD